MVSLVELLPGRFSSACEFSSSRLPEQASGMFYVEASHQGYAQGPDAMDCLRASCLLPRPRAPCMRLPNVESVELIAEESEAILCVGYSAMFKPREKGKCAQARSQVSEFQSIGHGGKLSQRPVAIARRGNPIPATDAGSNLLEPA